MMVLGNFKGRESNVRASNVQAEGFEEGGTWSASVGWGGWERNEREI